MENLKMAECMEREKWRTKEVKNEREYGLKEI